MPGAAHVTVAKIRQLADQPDVGVTSELTPSWKGRLSTPQNPQNGVFARVCSNGDNARCICEGGYADGRRHRENSRANKVGDGNQEL